MMEEEFEEFLRVREIDEEIIKSLKDEKIDVNTINLMEDNQLAKFVPTYGDRIAITDFCRRKLSTKRRNGLLDKLKKKIKRKSKLKGEKVQTSDSEEEKLDSKTNKKVFRKNSRLIDLGWMHSDDGIQYHQVRTKCGGGTRRISVPINANKYHLITHATKLFFPKGVSSKGRVDDFFLNLRDYEQNIMEDDTITVGDIYIFTGFSKIRFYLSTQRIEKCNAPTNPENSSLPGPSSYNQATEHAKQSPLSEPPTEELPDTFYGTFIDDENPEFDLLNFTNHDQTNSELNRVTNGNTVAPVVISVDSPISLYPIENDKLKLTLHRGRILEELIHAFTILDKNCSQLLIEMILPNGKPEMGFDVGGVFRDALSEFWTSFYDMCTVGAKTKIPYLRHDYGTVQWKAAARILYKGYKEENYFPLQLALPFMEYCFTGKSESSLYQYFLKFISDSDANTIIRAMEDFNSVDDSEIQDLFDNLESKWLPSAENIEKLVMDIAHKELIQKPKFIIDCWYEELKMLPINLEEIYKTIQPTSKNIQLILKLESELSADATKVFGFLKKFIREADDDIRSSFLRFCTGADVLVGKNITVNFIKVDGFQRTPIAHTCSCALELPLSYDSFPEFRSEFNTLLKSNVWIMDLV